MLSEKKKCIPTHVVFADNQDFQVVKTKRANHLRCELPRELPLS